MGQPVATSACWLGRSRRICRGLPRREHEPMGQPLGHGTNTHGNIENAPMASDNYTSALTTTTLPHRRGMCDMLIRGKEGHGNACNGSTSEEVIHGVSAEREDSNGGAESGDEPRHGVRLHWQRAVALGAGRSTGLADTSGSI